MNNRERIQKAQDNLVEALDYEHELRLIEHDTHLFLDHGADIKESVKSQLKGLRTMIDLLEETYNDLYDHCNE